MIAKSFKILQKGFKFKRYQKNRICLFSENNEKDTEKVKEIKIPEIKNEEFKGKRVHHETLCKLLDPLHEHMPDEIKRAKEEIKSLNEESKYLEKVTKDLENLAKVNDKNQQNLKTLIEKLKGSEQECERIHERLSKKLDQEKTFAITKFAKDCLEILDNFDRCFESVKKQEDQNFEQSDFYQGVEMTYRSTLNIFSRYKISPMENPVGKQVDFNKHEVVFVTQNPNLENNEVIYVNQKGYEIDGRVLREAKVGVVKND